ncbi:hypothetical protein C4901_15300 [Acidiferrobacter sp. SPIII_3]|uniref:hypothetical protein n=1 Tax=Acidiferrobacter sp. SPIII_3 TaxID=1281578 RepID=UPI000D731A67|nr:hypothetical protein [Acidiferrobacter sp. SPIII_3]AWP24522.1 hypothetical protein C4901_15300 [Acidiferrobacter sp. SPIII_3]
MDKTIGPAARTLRFLALTLGIAGAILWAVRWWVPQPWTVIVFLGRDLRATFWHHEFWFNGRWHHPGRGHFDQSYAYVAGSWQASLMVGAALFVGGVGALWLDRLIVRWLRTPTRPMS